MKKEKITKFTQLNLILGYAYENFHDNRGNDLPTNIEQSWKYNDQLHGSELSVMYAIGEFYYIGGLKFFKKLLKKLFLYLIFDRPNE